jgi:hypothetical protein
MRVRRRVGQYGSVISTWTTPFSPPSKKDVWRDFVKSRNWSGRTNSFGLKSRFRDPTAVVEITAVTPNRFKPSMLPR